MGEVFGVRAAALLEWSVRFVRGGLGRAEG